MTVDVFFLGEYYSTQVVESSFYKLQLAFGSDGFDILNIYLYLAILRFRDLFFFGW